MPVQRAGPAAARPLGRADGAALAGQRPNFLAAISKRLFVYTARKVGRWMPGPNVRQIVLPIPADLAYIHAFFTERRPRPFRPARPGLRRGGRAAGGAAPARGG